MDGQRIIFHVDVNSAFLSWEAAYRIHHLGGSVDLRGIPSAVCGDAALRHGIVLAKSIPARAYGIQTGMTVGEAVQRCPKLYKVPPNYSLYQKCSDAFLDILREYTPGVEVYSIDEAFLDMTETAELFGGWAEASQVIRRRVEEELGFTVNIGISINKVLAKMAGEREKPNRIHTLFPEEIEKKLWPLPVSELFMAGPSSARRLYGLGIRTIGELAAAEPEMLREHLGKQGEVLRAFANGRDISEVTEAPPPQKGYGNSTTVCFDVTKSSEARLVLLGLSETLSARLREADVRAELLSVEMKSWDFHVQSHQRRLNNPTNITKEIYRYACGIFEELWDGYTPVRHIGIYAGRLREGETARQQMLFDREDYGKLECADRMTDEIRERYGTDAVKRAVFLKGPVDHMSGGISREKWKVDYRKIRVD